MKRRISPTAVQSLALVFGCGAAGLCLSTVSGEALPGALPTTILGAAIGLIAVAVGLIVRRPVRAFERLLSAAAARSKTGRSIRALRGVKERGPGCVELIKIGAIPIFVHWSLPIGGLLISTFGGLDLKRALYFSIGYLLRVGVHEAGHATAARSCGLKVFAVELSGIGGLCRSELTLNAKHCALVYSGGLLAQALLLGLALCWMLAFGPPKSEFGTCLLSTTTIVNLILLLFNLVPFEERSGLRTDGLALFTTVVGCLFRCRTLMPRHVSQQQLRPTRALPVIVSPFELSFSK